MPASSRIAGPPPRTGLTTVDDIVACQKDRGWLDPEPGVLYVMGLDLGLKKDAAVLSVCHAVSTPEGRVIVLDRQQVWQGTRRKPVDIGEVEATCRMAHETYNRAPLVCDPWNSAQLMQNLKAKRVPILEYIFTAQSVGRLAQRLYNVLREHALDLPQSDEGLRDELANVRINETSPGVFRMDHDPDKHDDRAISLALCVNYLFEHAPRRARMVFKDVHSRSLRRTWETRVVLGTVR